jgi:hypothetical protein
MLLSVSAAYVAAIGGGEHLFSMVLMDIGKRNAPERAPGQHLRQ